MGDEENKDAKNEDAKTKEDEDAVAEPGCCFHYGQCIVGVLKSIYKGTVFTIMFIGECISYCTYPAKERMYECCECCGKRLEQHNDPDYGTF